MTYPEINKTSITTLYVAVVAVCLGRAYQCLFWDIPIRSLLWDEDLISVFIETVFHLNWDQYLKHPNANATITGLVSTIGITLIISLLFIVCSKDTKIKFPGLVINSLLLVFIAFLYHLEKFKTAGQFFEYSLQFMSPVLLWLFIKNGLNERWIVLAKICVALTFISHGLYAFGFYPVPGNFVSMTVNILGVEDGVAISFLKVVGVLDIILSIGLFFKGRIFKLSVWYCIIWGALTAFARVVANVEVDFFLPSMHQWLYETVYRMPHFLIPLVLLIINKD